MDDRKKMVVDLSLAAVLSARRVVRVRSSWTGFNRPHVTRQNDVTRTGGEIKPTTRHQQLPILREITQKKHKIGDEKIENSD